MGFTPSSGEELQSEYLLPRRYAVEASETVRTLENRIQPTLYKTRFCSYFANYEMVEKNIVPLLHGGGQGFESPRLHFRKAHLAGIT